MISDQVAELLGAKVAGVTALGTGSAGTGAYRVALLSGGNVFAKAYPGKAAGFLAAEAAGLRWLREADGAPVPEVLGEREDLLVTAWITPGRTGAAGAEEFGRELATVHARGAQSFGAPWHGYIGALPMDNTESDDWPSFYAERRVLPYLRSAVDRGALDLGQAADIELVCTRIEELAGPPELPARVHGGHRETDLAMMALFEPPELEAILGAYDEVHPLSDGWRERVALHQLHPLLVHAAMFGGSYGAQALAAARQYL